MQTRDCLPCRPSLFDSRSCAFTSGFAIDIISRSFNLSILVAMATERKRKTVSVTTKGEYKIISCALTCSHAYGEDWCMYSRRECALRDQKHEKMLRIRLDAGAVRVDNSISTCIVQPDSDGLRVGVKENECMK